MAEPLLTLAANPDVIQGTLRMGGISHGKQSLENGGPAFSRLLAGHAPGAGGGLEGEVASLPALRSGTLIGQILAADGKELPDAARLLSLAGLVLEDGEGTPLPATEPDRPLATDSSASASREAGLPLTDPVAVDTTAPPAARPWGLEAVPGEPSSRPAGGQDNPLPASRPLIGAEWRLSTETAAAGRAQATLAPPAVPLEAMSMPEQARLPSALQQALQPQAGEEVAREARFGELVRSAALQGGEPAPRADTSAGFGSQAGANAHVQAHALPATAVAIPLRQPGWSQALGEQVQWMVGSKLQGAEIRLNPAHLGPMEVRIQIQNDQANINFTAQHGLVREALEAAIPRLREMLGESGLQLNNVTVSDQSLAEQRRQERQDAFADRSTRGGEGVVEDEAQVLVTPLREAAGTIDFFA